jgi:TonB-linked SusC/RagA family outer membrane protein
MTMNKLNNIRGFLLVSLFSLFLFSGVRAQESLLTDTTTAKLVPGHVFSTTKEKSTAAISTVSGENLGKTVSLNFTNTFAGQLPGLSIRQSNGLPNEAAKWLIRGVGSQGMGRENTAKLYVDGFEVNADYLSNLSPLEIESVSVLKDAASLGTFGMRGANGVIWIETKRGKIGKSTISVRAKGGIQQPVNLNSALNSYDFASLYNQAVSNDNGRVWSPYYSADELAKYKNGTAPDVNWNDQVLSKNGNYMDGDILFNGGNRNARYNIVLSYANQAGLLDAKLDNLSNPDASTVQPNDALANIQQNKVNLRSNFDFNLMDIFEARIDLGGRIENRKTPNYDVASLMNDIANYPSNIYNVYDDKYNEHFSGTTLYPNNPIGSAKGLGWRSYKTRILQGNFRLKEKLDFITPGLSLEEAISFYARTLSTYNKTRNYARYQNGQTTTTDQTTSLVAGGYGSGGMEDWKQYLIALNYANSFGKHAITSAFGIHISDYKGDGLFSYKYHYLNYNGKVNYAYNDKYVAELGLSYFGSDSYAPGNRYGLYPTLSAAWILSKESFLQSNETVNLFKLRASAGRTGAADSDESLDNFSSNGRFLYQQYYINTGGFNSGNTTPYQGNTGLEPLFIANKDAKAETSLKYNIGLDINLLKKLDITFDAFLDKRSDILTFDNSVMSYYGRNWNLRNMGKMTNQGFELSATWTDKIGNLDYSIFGMASYAKNKIDYMGEVPTPYSYNARTGRPFGTLIGLVSDGFYGIEDFNADGSLKNGIPVSTYGSVQPGDLKYKDLDNDGFIDDTDVTEIGKSAFPELYYSFGGQLKYKGFDFNLMFRGAARSSVNLLNYSSQFIAFINNGNAYQVAKGAWAYYPEQNIDTRQTATYPRLTTASNGNNYRNSSFWVKDNNFLRIQYVELGYNFNPKALKSKGFSNIRIFLNATNPLTWSSLLKDYNMDPETSFGYPALSTYTLGLSITL